VRYGAVHTSLLEEDQVATLEVGPVYPPTVVPILLDWMVDQSLAEVPEDEFGEASAIFLLESPAGSGRGEPVGGAEVPPAVP
jgi:hypothetical protein